MSVNEEKKGGLFGRPKQPVQSPVRPQSQNANSLNTRMRVLEERLFNLQKKFHVRDENMLDTNKTVGSDLKTLNRELGELKTQVSDLKEQVRIVADELSSKANESEFLVLKKYLELWRPLNFVTAADVQRLVEKSLKAQASPTQTLSLDNIQKLQ
jgi:hypothetical protein